MNPRVTAVLLVVTAALAAALYWFEVRGGEQRRLAEEEARQLFPDLEAEDVEEIALTTADGVEVRAVRADGSWRIVAPREAPGDDIAWDGIAAAIADMASESVFEEPQPPDVYGLGDAARVVRFRARGEEHVLRLGRRTPVGGNTYASVDDDPRVFTVASYRTSPFTRRFEELRDRRLARFDREAVRRLEASWPGGRVVLERRDDGWHLVEPIESRADEATVQTLLSDLQFLRAEGFVDDPAPEDLAKLDPPAFRVVLELAPPDDGDENEAAASEGPEAPDAADAAAGAPGDAEGEPGAERSEGAEPAAPRRLEIVIGGPLDDETRIARGASGALYRISADRLDDFPRRVVAWRFKELTDFAPGEAARVEMIFREPGGAEPSLTVVAEAAEEGWRTEPVPLAPGAMARIVSQLATLRAEDIVAESMGPEERARLGLEPPRVVFRVLGPGEDPDATGEVLAEVHLGVGDAKRGIVASVPGREIVYRLPYGVAEDLPISREALEERFVEEEGAEAEVGGATGTAPAEEGGAIEAAPAEPGAGEALPPEAAEEDAATAGEAEGGRAP